MKLYFTKTPKFIPRIFRSQIWSFSTSKKELFLTFDDGPTQEVTPWVLDQLATFNAKATFFCLGKNIETNHQIFQSLINQGHSIANHTYEHLNGWKTPNKVYYRSIDQTEQIIRSITGKESRLFRPPYGKIKTSQSKFLKKKGFSIIMWSVLSADFDLKLDIEKCLSKLIKHTEPGDILVFHDSQKAFKNLKLVLPQVLKHFTNLGYSFNKINTETNDHS